MMRNAERDGRVADLLDEDGRVGNELGEWTEGAVAKTVGLWEAIFPSSAGSPDAGAG